MEIAKEVVRVLGPTGVLVVSVISVYLFRAQIGFRIASKMNGSSPFVTTDACAGAMGDVKKSLDTVELAMVDLKGLGGEVKDQLTEMSKDVAIVSQRLESVEDCVSKQWSRLEVHGEDIARMQGRMDQ